MAQPLTAIVTGADLIRPVIHTWEFKDDRGYVRRSSREVGGWISLMWETKTPSGEIIAEPRTIWVSTERGVQEIMRLEDLWPAY